MLSLGSSHRVTRPLVALLWMLVVLLHGAASLPVVQAAPTKVQAITPGFSVADCYITALLNSHPSIVRNNPLDKEYDAYVTRGWKSDGVAINPLIPFWEGSGTYSLEAIVNGQNVFDLPFYTWNLSGPSSLLPPPDTATPDDLQRLTLAPSFHLKELHQDFGPILPSTLSQFPKSTLVQATLTRANDPASTVISGKVKVNWKLPRVHIYKVQLYLRSEAGDNEEVQQLLEQMHRIQKHKDLTPLVGQKLTQAAFHSLYVAPAEGLLLVGSGMLVGSAATAFVGELTTAAETVEAEETVQAAKSLTELEGLQGEQATAEIARLEAMWAEDVTVIPELEEVTEVGDPIETAEICVVEIDILVDFIDVPGPRLPKPVPTAAPTAIPTEMPTAIPTQMPTALPPNPTPTAQPTATPTATTVPVPTVFPTALPTTQPQPTPTVQPTPTEAPKPLYLWAYSTSSTPELWQNDDQQTNQHNHNPSWQSGYYLTTMTEVESDNLRTGQQSFALYSHPYNWGGSSTIHYRQIRVDDLPVAWHNATFDQNHTNSVWLLPPDPTAGAALIAHTVAEGDVVFRPGAPGADDLPFGTGIPTEGTNGNWVNADGTSNPGARGHCIWRSTDANILDDLYPDPAQRPAHIDVQFHNGYPDFSPWLAHPEEWSSGTMNLSAVFGRSVYTGDGEGVDFPAANRVIARANGWFYRGQPNAAAGERVLTEHSPRLTWHHYEDMQTLMMVPTSLNDNISHQGGASFARKARW